MSVTRRHFVGMGGGLLATLSTPLLGSLVRAADVIEIGMNGRPDGAVVWFDPIGVLIQPGQTVRWVNHDPGNSHTATAYHPEILERSLRIAEGATPWDSDYLLPEESFEVTFTAPGVYDYYCAPHEHAGMVGRIVVGDLPAIGWWSDAALLTADPDLPEAALKGFPAIEEIIAKGIVRPA